MQLENLNNDKLRYVARMPRIPTPYARYINLHARVRINSSRYRNNMFHSQLGTRNKTFLNYQFGNNMFHFQLGTRNEMFLFYLRVNVLFLTCKKAIPLNVNGNTKMRNSRY